MLVSSCGNKDKKESETTSYLPAPERQFDHEDSTEVNRLVNEYVASMANHNIDSCMRMLYYVKNDSVFPLGVEQQKEFKDAWTKLHIYGAKCKSVVLRSNRNNDVSIVVQILSSGDIDKEVGVTSFHLNPVYKDGAWFLTMLSERAEGVYNVFDENSKPSNVGVVH